MPHLVRVIETYGGGVVETLTMEDTVTRQEAAEAARTAIRRRLGRGPYLGIHRLRSLTLRVYDMTEEVASSDRPSWRVFTEGGRWAPPTLPEELR